MPSSDAPRRGMGRGFLWFVVVGNALLGSALTVVSLGMLTQPGTWSTAVSLVAAAAGVHWVAAGAVGFHRMYLRRPRLDGARVTTTTTDDGRPAVELAWARTIIAVPAFTVAGLVVLLAAATVLQAADGDAGAGAWFTGGLALLLALLLPDSLLRLRRRARLVLTPQAVELHGWDGDGVLAWDDVVGATLVETGSWTSLRLVGRPGSTLGWRRRPRLLFAPAPRGPHLDVPAPAVDVDVRFLAGTLLHYAQNPAARAEIADGRARTRLAEHVRPLG
ncbi:hypothetical protein [Cellulomonas telluris]|uniref:hypothetical protein n=1 Tax=Cellulomonas telluris TaxID=2306636 RepID=UPI0010A825F6|nr:hypothetical protein [Cellulomonas telluris]